MNWNDRHFYIKISTTTTQKKSKFKIVEKINQFLRNLIQKSKILNKYYRYTYKSNKTPNYEYLQQWIVNFVLIINFSY